MFLGLRTAIYHVEDLAQAKDWYARALGFGPYFDEPFYVGFDVGGFELGLHPKEEDNPRSSPGVVAYWRVESAGETFRRLVGLGATEHEDVRDVGGGTKVASVLDPFGNVLGVIEMANLPAE